MKNLNHDNNDNKMTTYLKTIETILTRYEANATWILYGLELVGFENADFWLKVVDYVNKTKGLDAIGFYVTSMSQINKEDLLEVLKNINNPELFPEFVNSYLMFVNLLNEVSNVKRNSKKSK